MGRFFFFLTETGSFYVDQACLELRDPPALSPKGVLTLVVCATTSNFLKFQTFIENLFAKAAITTYHRLIHQSSKVRVWPGSVPSDQRVCFSPVPWLIDAASLYLCACVFPLSVFSFCCCFVLRQSHTTLGIWCFLMASTGTTQISIQTRCPYTK